MAAWMPGQVVSVEQFRYHDFDAVDWLQRIGSPRAADMPQLGIWCMAAGQAADIDPRVALTMLEKEQSFITWPTPLTGHRRDWAMGFGVYPDGTHLSTWRGEPNIGPEPQIKHALLRLRELADGQDPGLTPNMGFPLENGPTRALYTYNPSVSGNYNFWAIFHRWFGDGGGTAGSVGLEARPTRTPIEATKSDVANVAHEACAAHRAGRRTCTINGVAFDLVTTGWCGRFVRQCYAAAVRAYDPSFDEFGFGWLAADAWHAEINLREQGYEIPTRAVKPGDIVCLNAGLNEASHGHIGIHLGDMIAENTSRQGLGTVETPLAVLEGRVSGTYGVLPSGDLDVPGIAVVYPSDIEHAKRVDCGPFIGSDGRMYVQVAPYTVALGKIGTYKRVNLGTRVVERYYVKDA